MATNFTVHSVLVTGANRGIGLNLVKRFLSLPAPPQWVFATHLKNDEAKFKDLNELKSQHRNLELLQLDVTNLESIQEAVKQVQERVGEYGLTLLVNNAALRLDGDLETETAEQMASTYATNTIGPHQVSQAFLPLLKTAAQRSSLQGLSCRKAAVVNISSSGGSIELMFLWNQMQRVAYRCSKAALNMLTKCQSLVYPEYGILCVCIHPGWVKTGKTEAPLTEEESTQGIVHVLSTLSKDDNGTFVDWEGQRLPW
ncbi:C-factor-like [Eublepharis macularius]|uniref:C-factor-like n=1 Tax=Eublepharis macularius TaxID=481883 RepID=A0AA97LHZ5_EUBMA|nr:C-factor-like [Eublepharis macularius]